MRLQKVITTIHIDRNTTLEKFRVAAEFFVQQAEDHLKRHGREYNRRVDDIVQQWRRITSGNYCKAPLEIRFDDMNTEPVIVVHPGVRGAGDAMRSKSVSDGQWVTLQTEKEHVANGLDVAMEAMKSPGP